MFETSPAKNIAFDEVATTGKNDIMMKPTLSPGVMANLDGKHPTAEGSSL
jgi:hypothetical protein